MFVTVLCNTNVRYIPELYSKFYLEAGQPHHLGCFSQKSSKFNYGSKLHAMGKSQNLFE